MESADFTCRKPLVRVQPESLCVRSTMVVQTTLNREVEGSNPSERTRPCDLMVRICGFQPHGADSIPVTAILENK